MIKDTKPIRRDQLLQTFTKDYEPATHLGLLWYPHERTPRFRRWFHVEQMLRDPRIDMALSYLKGTILSLSRVFVDEDDSAIKEFLVNQINRWWRTSAVKMLSALEWGYSGTEVLYCVKDGMIAFDNTKPLHPSDLKAVTMDGSLVGMELSTITGEDDREPTRFIGGAKALWHVYRRERHPWYGVPRLLPAYSPWQELHAEGGGRDIRRLYFYKYAFQGDFIRHPPGSFATDTGVKRPFKDVAREIIEHARSGGSIAVPAVYDENGNPLWDLVSRGDSGGAAMDVLQYPEELKKEMAEGIGVPAELIEAAETGSGFSGRKVPQNAFRGMLSDEVFWLVQDFNEQVLIPLIRLNFGITEPTHELIPFGMVRDDDEESEGPITMPGQQVPESATERAQFSVAT